MIGSGGAVSSRILASNLPAGTLKSVADFEAITQHKKEHMMRLATLSAVILIPLLVACESQAERQADLTEDRIEQQANASAVAAGSQIVALGLTEAQLLDADLVGADGTDLGDIEQVRRGPDGAVEGVLVSIENTDPDRYVLVPLKGLTTRVRGRDTDLQTTLNAQGLAALPDAPLDALTAPSA